MKAKCWKEFLKETEAYFRNVYYSKCVIIDESGIFIR